MVKCKLYFYYEDALSYARFVELPSGKSLNTINFNKADATDIPFWEYNTQSGLYMIDVSTPSKQNNILRYIKTHIDPSNYTQLFGTYFFKDWLTGYTTGRYATHIYCVPETHPVYNYDLIRSLFSDTNIDVRCEYNKCKASKIKDSVRKLRTTRHIPL